MPSPYLSSVSIIPVELFSIVPGEVVRGFSVLEGAPDFWNGHILLDDRAMPVLAAGSGLVEFQVPWDAPVRTGSFRVHTLPVGSLSTRTGAFL